MYICVIIVEASSMMSMFHNQEEREERGEKNKQR